MIYLIGFQQDIVISYADSVFRGERKHKPDFKILHIEDIRTVQLDFNSFFLKFIQTNLETIEVNESDSIYLRPYAFEAAKDISDIDQKLLSQFSSTYQNLLLSRQVKIGNTSLRSESNNNKIMHPLGFSDLIPTPSFVCSNLFIGPNDSQDQVAKSPSHVRTQVVSYEELAIRAKDGLRMPPAVIQKRIFGNSIRVTVVNFEEVIAAQVNESTDVDYRYGAVQKFEPISLPTKINEAVLKIAKRYGLPLCGIDLMCNEQDWFFLEVNPEPGWAFLSEEENFKILSKIIEFLSTSLTSCEVLPDGSLNAHRPLKSQFRQLETDVTPYPQELLPMDFIARPGEQHPFWSEK